MSFSGELIVGKANVAVDLIVMEAEMATDKQKVEKALSLITEYGGIDGAHHKQWLLDQLVRVLSDDWEAWVKQYEAGEDGTLTYRWDIGIAP